MADFVHSQYLGADWKTQATDPTEATLFQMKGNCGASVLKSSSCSYSLKLKKQEQAGENHDRIASTEHC